jgi:hypothetical protein
MSQVAGQQSHASRPEPARLAGLKHAFAIVFLRDWHPVLRDPLGT